MPKKQDVTVVSDLVGRGKFTVSAKGKMVDGELVGVVPTTSFEIEVKYKDQIEKMEYAVPTSIICLQGFLRDEYLATGKFAFAAGSRIKVGANGKYFRPAPMPSQERLLDATWAEKIMIAETFGLPVPPEWRAAAAAVSEETEETAVSADSAESFRYDVIELRKQTTQKLRQLAQTDDISGYATKPRNELIDDLGAITK